jgi:hypothetical protein
MLYRQAVALFELGSFEFGASSSTYFAFFDEKAKLHQPATS